MRKFVLAAVLVAVACSPKVLPPVVVYRDSVRVEVHERVDTVSFEVPVIVEKNVTRDTSSHLENDWAASDATLTDGFLEHTLRTKGQKVYIPVIVRDTLVVEKEATETIVTKEVEKPLTRWQNYRLRAFWWLILGLVALLTYTFRKPILSLLRKVFLKI